MVVATDVAARGLDVKDIALVINYDFPTGTLALLYCTYLNIALCTVHISMFKAQ